MASALRRNVLGLVAIFIATTGTAVGLPGRDSVDSGDIVNQQVKAKDLQAGAVRTSKLAESAVDSTKVADESLTGADLLGNSVTGAQISESSLGTVPSATVAGNALSLGGVAAPLHVRNVQVVKVTSPNNESTSKQEFAQCPASTRAIGGGAGVIPAEPDIAVTVAMPEVTSNGTNGWIGAASETDLFPDAWTLTVVAICASIK